jgi:hypothetical protein
MMHTSLLQTYEIVQETLYVTNEILFSSSISFQNIKLKHSHLKSGGQLLA